MVALPASIFSSRSSRRTVSTWVSHSSMLCNWCKTKHVTLCPLMMGHSSPKGWVTVDPLTLFPFLSSDLSAYFIISCTEETSKELNTWKSDLSKPCYAAVSCYTEVACCKSTPCYNIAQWYKAVPSCIQVLHNSSCTCSIIFIPLHDQSTATVWSLSLSTA